MKKNYSSRRNFLRQSALATGLAAFGPYGFTNNSLLQKKTVNKLPREVWIAGISQMGLQTQTSQLMLDEIMYILDNVVVYQPDIICLPETFPIENIDQHFNLSEKLEISKKHYYNSPVLQNNITVTSFALSSLLREGKHIMLRWFSTEQVPGWENTVKSTLP